MSLSPLQIEQMWSAAIKEAASTGFSDVFVFARAVESAAVEAYKASLKQVAWQHDGQGRIDVLHDKARQLWIDARKAHKVAHYTIPLYRLDQP
jgi:hypothetical protein